MRKYGEGYSNEIKRELKIWTARNRIYKESIEAHAHKNSKHNANSSASPQDGAVNGINHNDIK